ncbi:ubiquitin carboxyl-terminal hydrolase 16 [Pseudophryne corroboree]|uniref:ubiquitin carboxyl-terminal hydrolase 16 n=1 Tax=Pseudophryne corroboree TaxID=495146 RepID=UPI003081BFDA
MVKKQVKNLPVQDSVEAEPTCKHIRKGLDEGTVKRALVNVEWDVCQDCQTDSKEAVNDGQEEHRESDVVWLCLRCGHRGCGRYSERQHALNHYNTPRSEPHCLVISVGEWNVWCYLCDNQVDYECSSRLRQLVEYVKKKSKLNSRTANTVQSGQEVCSSEKAQEKEVQQAAEDSNTTAIKEEPPKTFSESKEGAVRGLSNLGNTCFFNAVMQNLSQTPTLRELLNDVKHPGKTVTVKEPNSSEPSQREVTLEQQAGPLTLAMWQFVTEMQETKKGVVTPKELFSQVCKKSAQFRGYQQQDSQELLRYLLDGMRGEEIQRVSSAISKTLQDAAETIDESEMKKLIKDYEKRRAIPNFVDRLFGGELTSTIMCETCHTVSLVREPFLDLSLPVLDDSPAKKNSTKASKPVYVKAADDDDDSYVKERSDVPPGGSKHLQKKAKKQAKKQAKHQRRQQKIQDKTMTLSDHNVSHPADEESVSDNNTVGNNAEQQEETDGLCLSTTDKTDVEKTEEGLEQQENDMELCLNNLQSNADVDAEDLSREAVGNLDDGHGLGTGNVDNNEGSSENLENNSEVIEVLENSDSSLVDMDNSDGKEGTLDVESLQAEDDTEVSRLTDNINRLNLSSDLEPNDIEIEIIDEPPRVQIYEVVNEDPKTAFCTLSDRTEMQLDEWSVLSCLYHFTRTENLVGNNQLLCNTCTQKQATAIKNNTKGDNKFVYTNAKKQMLVSAPPPILTLHLKRFQQNGFNLHKINKHIKFPEVIDLAPFCTVKCKNISDGESRLLYSLYGVIEHSGTMRSGHYTAYVKSRVPNPNLGELVLRGVLPEVSNTEPLNGHWYHISDSHVQTVPITKVLGSQAYLLFYERIL